MVAQNNSSFGPVGQSTKIGDVYQGCTCLRRTSPGRSADCRLNGLVNPPSLQTYSPCGEPLIELLIPAGIEIDIGTRVPKHLLLKGNIVFLLFFMPLHVGLCERQQPQRLALRGAGGNTQERDYKTFLLCCHPSRQIQSQG